MNDKEAKKIVWSHLEQLFPKTCPNCRRTFASYPEYVKLTKPMGPVVSFDTELGEWQPSQPSGLLAMANCPCGNTLGLSSEGMSLDAYWKLLSWAKEVVSQRQITITRLLGEMRAEIRHHVVDKPMIKGNLGETLSPGFFSGLECKNNSSGEDCCRTAS